MLENTELPQIIYLIGYMGSGKTTLGKKLSAKIGYAFVDLDHMFEEQEGMTIADYFTSKGEDAFREEESRILKQTKHKPFTVVSTGGGAPCFFDNMQWMNTNGTTIYIKLSSKTLADRLENAKEARPILRDKHGDELASFIEEKLAERERFYNQANYIVDGLSLSADRLAEVISKKND